MAMPATARSSSPDAAPPLPADDPAIFEMDLRALRRHWAAQAALPAISAETMTGRRPPGPGARHPEERLMEHAGTAVAAAVRALAVDLDRWGSGPIVILCGPGNNGGDGFVAARRLALAGASVDRRGRRVRGPPARRDRRPQLGPDRARHGDRQGPPRRSPATSRCSARASRRPRSSSTRCSGPASAAPLREPIRSAVEVIGRARAAGVPVVAVDTPTAVDLSSGEPSDPAVRADLTVTFHRPKTGLLTRRGAALRRQGPRRPDRDPAGGRPWLTRRATAGSRAGARSCSSPAAAVAVVLGAAVVTSSCRPTRQAIVFHTPLLIVVLIVGTGWLLWRIARRPPATPGA